MNIQDIINKYDSNGIDLITSNEVEFIYDYFCNENASQLGDEVFDKLCRIVLKFCIKYDNTSLAVKFAEVEYKHDDFKANIEFLSPFVNKQLNNNNTDILKYDTPCVNYCLGLYYEEKDGQKALEYFKKGAFNYDSLCVDELLRYYACDPECYVEPPLEKIDFENAFNYMILSIDLTGCYCISGSIFNELEKLPVEERKKYDNIVNNSNVLLEEKYRYYNSKYKTSNDKNEFYKAFNSLSLLNDINNNKSYNELQKLYENSICKEDISRISELINTSKIELLNEYSGDLLLSYGLYFRLNNQTDKEITCLKFAAEKNNAYALYLMGFMYYDGKTIKKDTVKGFEYLEKSTELGCLAAPKCIIYYPELSCIRPEKLEKYYSILCEKSTNPDLLYNFGYGYYNGSFHRDYCIDMKIVEPNYRKAEQCFERAVSLGGSGSRFKYLQMRYLNGKEIDFEELLRCSYQNDKNEYIDKIKCIYSKGKKIVSIDIMKIYNQLKQNNNQKNIVDYLINYVDTLPSDTIINIRQSNYDSPIYDLYDKNDLKGILYKSKLLLNNVDLNQKEEDIFMQIYIKLGKLINYNNDVAKEKIDKKSEKKYTTRNLLTLLNNDGVCAGYAYALQFLANLVGIESNVIVSQGKNGEAHVFNQVKINDEWYYCDLTWDTSLMNIGFITNCLKSKKSFEKESMRFFFDKRFHVSRDNDFVNISNNNFKNVFKLFRKNYKLIKHNNYSMIVKEECGKRM